MIDQKRFFSHVQCSGVEQWSCWTWIGALRDDGRGRFDQGREMLAHHAAYEIQTGKPVPTGYRLRRFCQNPQCVRHWTLERLYQKLPAEAITSILKSKKRCKDLAKDWGVSSSHISNIRARRRRA